MSSVDQRVVEMKFDKGEFGRGVDDTIRALENLKKALKLEGASKGFEEVQKVAGRFNLNNISSVIGTVHSGFQKLLNPIDTVKTALGFQGATKGIEQVQASAGRFSLSAMTGQVQQVQASFSALTVAATTAFATIIHKATEAAGALAKTFTTAPLTGGLAEYEKKLGSIQTILSNTQAAGTNLDQVSGALNELNHYSDQTIYNFGEMARNIGTFTAAGVELDTATASIKGIANLAALSGSSSQQASTAMYQLSQAISAGKVSLMDWNSVVNAGMGGSVFQRALAETAVAMGKLEAGALKLEGPMKNVKINGEAFRQSISAENGESWLTSDVLTTALANFTGDITDAELAAQGFNAEQIKAIQSQAKAAKDAATIVKTGSQLMGTLKESAESGWAQTWELIIGDFEEAKMLWTGVNRAIGGILESSAKTRNALISDWKNLGGRNALIEGIKLSWEALLSIVKPIKDAFRDIFPAKTGRQLLDMTVAFREFARNLKIGDDTAAGLRRTFAGVFAIFSIAKQVISAIVGAFGRLFDRVGEGSGSILNFTGSIGDFLVGIDQALKKGGQLNKFFNGLADIIAVPVALIGGLAKAIGGLFGGFDNGAANAFGDAVTIMDEKAQMLQTGVGRVTGFFERLGEILANVAGKIGDVFSKVGDFIADGFAKIDTGKVLDIINTGLLAAIMLTIKKFFSGGDVAIDFGGGLLTQAKDALSGVSETMQNMQQNLKASILLKIAAAMLLMAGAIVMLATVDADKLAQSLGALATGMGIMGGAMVALVKALSTVGLVQVYVITAAFTKMALAMLLIAGALKILSSMDIGDTIQSLIAMGGALAIVAGAMTIMPKGIAAQAAALILLGVALNAIAVAMKIFGTMDWDEIARGLTALAGSLVVIAGAMHLMPMNMVLQAAALTILAVALNGIAAAMKIFATMSFGDIAHGLVALGGALVIIAGAMNLMPNGPNMVLQAAGLLAVSVALNIMAGALIAMGNMEWEEIGKGLAALGGALGILAIGLNLMTGTIGGSVALLAATAALVVLTPILITLGNLQWSTLIQSFVALAAAFAIFAIGGMALAGVTPVFLGLGAAMLLFGAGIALAGAGVLAFSTGISMLIALLGAGASAFLDFVGKFLGGVPEIAKGLVIALAEIIKQIVKIVPEIVKGFFKIFTSFIDMVVENAPKIVGGFVKILVALLDGVIDIVPKIGQAVTAILKTFLLVIIQNAPFIAQALISLLSGLLDVVIAVAPKMGQAFMALMTTALNVIVTMTPKIVEAGMQVLIGFLSGINNKLPQIIPLAVSIMLNFMAGLIRYLPQLITHGTSVVVSFLNGVGNNLPRVIQAGVELIIKFINGVSNAIRNNSSAVGAAGADLGLAIIEGMARAIAGGLGTIVSAAKKLASSALNAAKGVLGIASPSKEFQRIGEYVVEGFAKGITSGDQESVRAAFKDMLSMLEEEVERTTQKAAEANEALSQLYAKEGVTHDELVKGHQALEKANDERARAAVAYSKMTSAAEKEQFVLLSLADSYEKVTTKLQESTEALEDAKRTRDDYNRSVRESFEDGPSIDKDTRLVDFVGDLKTQVAATEKFFGTIQQLRKMGLNDETYKDIIAQGTEAQPLVDQLLAGGPAAVAEVNNLSKQLEYTSKQLGDYTAGSLYDAGVRSAQGLVDGLSSEELALRNKMEQIGQTMVNVLKYTLGIQSPSKEFADVGRWSNMGLANGLDRYKSLVKNSAEGVGDTAIETLRASMSNLGAVIRGEIDVTPTVRPVLDLSEVKKKASQMSDMLGVKPIDVGAAYLSARSVSAAVRANRAAGDEPGSVATAVREHVSFVQNNYSPKALSQADIYRNTKNQLSVVKGGLTTSADRSGSSN